MSDHGFNLTSLRSPHGASDATSQETNAYSHMFDPVEKAQIATEATSQLGLVTDRETAEEWMRQEFTTLKDGLRIQQPRTTDWGLRKNVRPENVVTQFTRLTDAPDRGRYGRAGREVATFEPFPSMTGSRIAAIDLLQSSTAMRFFGRQGPMYHMSMNLDGRTSLWTYENRNKFADFGGGNWLKDNGYPNHTGEGVTARALVGAGYATEDEVDARRNNHHGVSLLKGKSGQERAEILQALQGELSAYEIEVSRLTLSDFVIVNAMRAVEGLPLVGGLVLPGFNSRNISLSTHENRIFLNEYDDPCHINPYGTGIVLARSNNDASENSEAIA